MGTIPLPGRRQKTKKTEPRMSYKFIEHTADIAIELTGNDPEDLFRSAASAWLESVLDEINIEDKETKEFSLSDKSLEELLVNFLSEINFFLFTRKWILGNINSLLIEYYNNNWNLKAIISGEELKEDKHYLREEIKAVTFHQMKIERANNEYSTRIIFDI